MVARFDLEREMIRVRLVPTRNDQAAGEVDGGCMSVVRRTDTFESPDDISLDPQDEEQSNKVIYPSRTDREVDVRTNVGLSVHIGGFE